MKFFYRSLFFVLFTVITLFPQAGTYYNSIDPSLSSFITDLGTRTRVPYTQVSYDNFDETNIAFFASRDTTGGQRVVTCVYSGQNYVYTPPFTYAIFSREHTWCQSWMPSGGTTASKEGSDQHHLFPVNQNQVNGVRSNHPLGNVVNVTSTYLSAKIGTNANGKVVYEPRDTHKGDAARALFYMAVRYNGIGGYNWSFNTLQTYLTSHSEGPQDVATLIAWHKQDPPDKWEVDRNNYIQSIQQNRNPFVDHPEYVNYINFNDLSKLNPVYSTEPTNYASNLFVSSSGSLILNWTDAAAGSQTPSGYLLVAYDTSNYFLPIDGEAYTTDTDLSDGKAVVNIPYSDPNNYGFAGLTSNRRYYFTLYSYNGSGTSINYKIDGTLPQANGVYNGSVITEPTVQASNILFSSITSTGMTLNFTPGNGAYRIVLAHAVSDVDSNPVDGTTYNSNPIFGGGTQIGTGNYVLYKGTGSTVIVDGLNPNTTYYYKVYEYNGSGGSENYLTTSPASANTLTNSVTRPTIQASSLQFGTVGSTEITIKWIKGNGSARIVLAKSGSAVNDVPVDGAAYTDASAFGNGTQIGSGNYVVFKGSDTSVTVTGLLPASTYHFAVFEYNGPEGAQLYLTTGPAIGNQTTNETSHLIIAEVYGAGGNTGATYNSDFIVIYNPSASSVNLSGWSVQYASATGTSYSNKTSLSGTITNGGYFVIQESSGANGAALPHIDLPGGTIAMSSTAGKVALSRSTTTITGISDPNVVDYVGYGTTANVFEGSSPTPAPSTTTSVRRKLHGTQDSDDNFNDFATNDLTVNIPLPVELNTFLAETKDQAVILHWKTMTEKNSSEFAVEKMQTSNNGNASDWKYIGSVKASGLSNSPKEYSFKDASGSIGGVSYRLKMIDNDGSFEYSSIIDVFVAAPKKYELQQNYPNPFNPTTVINFTLPVESDVKLSLYDILGREVKVIVSAAMDAGYHKQELNASSLPSGIYFYRLTAKNRVTGEEIRFIKKLMLLK